ncbi:MAG: methionine--tRNA ligase subunit beta, partial [Lentisphaeria bacterium]|nr:methionine--tRNA ligase subunit beta [Lentisphaeria bacterium]
KKQEKKEKVKTVKPKQEEEPLPEGIITIDQFFKVQLKTAKILTAEPVENTEKLMKLTIEVGEEVRPLVAGIAQFYKPEELIGKTIVVVANLRPAKIRGNESRGMLLAAKNESGLKLVTIDGGDFPSGVSIG